MRALLQVVPLKVWGALAVVLAWAASLLIVGAWQRHDGQLVERQEWQAREAVELREANELIAILSNAYREQERQHAEALAGISADYERRLKDANAQRARDVAAARAGAIRLRDPYSLGLKACGNPAAQVGTGAGERDGGASGELSREAAEFLLGLANDADDIARQLAACQRVIVEDRAVVLP